MVQTTIHALLNEFLLCRMIQLLAPPGYFCAENHYSREGRIAVNFETCLFNEIFNYSKIQQ